MDYRTGQILDAIKEAGSKNNTIVIFTATTAQRPLTRGGRRRPLEGTYFTAMEASLACTIIIRWPGKVPAGRVSNEIVHIVDLFTTLAHVGGAEIPKIRPIDGVDQTDFSLATGKLDREDFPPTWLTGYRQ